MSNGIELKTIKEIIKYVGKKDCLLVRNIEGESIIHQVENWDKNPVEIIGITEKLYFNCFQSKKFCSAEFPDKNEEFYLRYCEFFD